MAYGSVNTGQLWMPLQGLDCFNPDDQRGTATWDGQMLELVVTQGAAAKERFASLSADYLLAGDRRSAKKDSTFDHPGSGDRTVAENRKPALT
jgi:hypothetical protein